MKRIFILLFALFPVINACCQTIEEHIKNGNAKHELKDYRGAIADYSKAIQLNPKFIKAYYLRGVAKAEMQDYNGAIADFSKIIELNPSDADAYFARGIAKIRLKQNESGCIDLHTAGNLGNDKAFTQIKKYCE